MAQLTSNGMPMGEVSGSNPSLEREYEGEDEDSAFMEYMDDDELEPYPESSNSVEPGASNEDNKVKEQRLSSTKPSKKKRKNGGKEGRTYEYVTVKRYKPLCKCCLKEGHKKSQWKLCEPQLRERIDELREQLVNISE